jgi:hypothetical protein
MAFFRQYVAPLIILLGFIFALVAVSARSFLPGDMLEPAAPIPVSGGFTNGQVIPAPPTAPDLDPTAPPVTAPAANALPPQLSQLVHGDAPAL